MYCYLKSQTQANENPNNVKDPSILNLKSADLEILKPENSATQAQENCDKDFFYENVTAQYVIDIIFIWFDRATYGEKAMTLLERTNEVAGVYAKGCVELAEELGLRSVNLWSKMQETDGWQKKYLRFVAF